MTAEYTMTVTAMDVYPESEGKANMVYKAYWTVTATDGDRSFTYNGKTDIPYNPDHHWWEYEDLIEDEVIEWICKNASDEVSAVYASLALNFVEEPAHEHSKPLPW